MSTEKPTPKTSSFNPLHFFRNIFNDSQSTEKKGGPTDKWNAKNWPLLYQSLGAGTACTGIAIGLIFLLSVSPMGLSLGIIISCGVMALTSAYLGYNASTFEKYEQATSHPHDPTYQYTKGYVSLNEILAANTIPPKFDTHHNHYAMLGMLVLSLLTNAAVLATIVVATAGTLALLTNPYVLAAMALCVVAMGASVLWYSASTKLKHQLNSTSDTAAPQFKDTVEKEWEHDWAEVKEIPRYIRRCFSSNTTASSPPKDPSQRTAPSKNHKNK